MFEKLKTWIDGNKTYLTAIATGVIAFLLMIGVEVPEYVYAILSAFGVYAVRSAISKTEPPK